MHLAVMGEHRQRCACRQARPGQRAGDIAYPDRHLVPAADLDGSAGETSLLGSYAQLCESFWHIRDTPEAGAGVKESCLADPTAPSCTGKVVVAVARLTSGEPDGDTYVARYSNCPNNVHTEAFLLNDPGLRLALRSAERPASLVVYLTLQPCHFSSNDARRSCTHELIAFYDAYCEPRGIAMRLAIGYTYRSHWSLANLAPGDRRRYARAIEQARAGLRIALNCARPGFTMTAFTVDDWTYLISLCDDEVVRDWACNPADSAVFTPDQCRIRFEMDKFVAQVLDEHTGTPAVLH